MLLNKTLTNADLSLWKQGDMTEFKITSDYLTASYWADLEELINIANWINSRIVQLNGRIAPTGRAEV